MSENDRTMLQFDWEDVEGKAITDISGQAASTLDDGTTCWTAIALIVGDLAVTINVDLNTDELSVSLESAPTGEAWAPIEPLAKYCGKELGWCWIGRNYRGYLDSFTVAFSGIDPGCMFVGIASTIWIKNVVALGAR